MDGLGVQPLVLRHIPDLGDLVDVIGIAQGVQRQLAVYREVNVLDQRRVGGIALTVQHAVAGNIAGAALGELTLQCHMHTGAVGV